MKPGDVVRLKSGGSPMTVEIVVGESVFCLWFPIAAYTNGHTPIYGDLEYSTFPKESLVEVPR